MIDGFTFVVSSLLARVFYSGPGFVSSDDLGAGIIAGFVFLVLAKFWGLYKFQTVLAPGRVTARIVAASLLGVCALICLVFLLKVGAVYSRGAILLFATVAAVLAPTARILLAAAAHVAIQAGFLRGRRVVLIGEQAELLRLTFREIANFGLDEVGRFPLSSGGVPEELTASDIARVEQAMQAARKFKAAEFALMLPWSRDRALSMITLSLRGSPLPVRLYPDYRTRDILLQKRESHFDPYLSVELQREPLSRVERSLKRAFDIALSSLALLCLAPLLLMTALMVKLDSAGPVLFLQTRCGFDNRPFKIWKFRTMTVTEDGPIIRQALRHDDRVTRVGRVLRRTSVDELPQLVNVLRGEMSLIGPRPHALAHDEEYGRQIADYAFRHHVRPGLTGYAQVCGYRGETKTLEQMRKRIEHDLWYINNWSFGLDLKIIFYTFLELLRHQAY
jgi:undecaprenyl-phosphate galactose phosphotransferase/putative colanic acid biosynthesis UDP-glucose lipid carrier transferase